MRPPLHWLFIVCLCVAIARAQSPAIELHWSFQESQQKEGFRAQSMTPPLPLTKEKFAYGPKTRGDGLLFSSESDLFVLAEEAKIVPSLLPKEAFTLSAWVAVDRPMPWGAMWSCLQDNGNHEKGLMFGYVNDRFAVGIATKGADDGNGKMTYVKAPEAFVNSRWHHVAATYDGQVTILYVDGIKVTEDRSQSGPILWDETAPFVIGGYKDKDETYPLDGRLASLRIVSEALDATAIAAEFQRRKDLTRLAPYDDRLASFLVAPFLTWPTKVAISVTFEASEPVRAEVLYRKDDQPESASERFVSEELKALHECRIEGLVPDQKYFYQVLLRFESGQTTTSPLLSFRTAASEDMAYTFVVIGDTQRHGEVAKRVSDLAYMHRPNFVVHAGDLVDTGRRKADWTETFFPSMQPLISRAPLMPVLGNHEQDAKHYYDYMSLPTPERWYSFRYGNAEFFMIDGNRSLADQSEQLLWLEGALKASTATWRFAVLHQPPYTSDSDDYGDTFKGPSKRGDPKVRPIIALFERYGLDICFSGHVHDYERTFPIQADRVRPYEEGGVIYVTSAGGGGSLENFDPANTWFGHKKAQYHHFVYVAIHHKQLELQAIDERGRLFDTITLIQRGR